MARRTVIAGKLASPTQLTGTGLPPKETLLRDFREDVTEYSRKDEYMLPEKADIWVQGQGIRKGHTKPHWPVFATGLNIGDRAILDSNIDADVDLRKIGIKLKQVLESLSPIDTGHYRQSFVFVVNGRFLRSLPVGIQAFGVANLAPHASTLDAPGKWQPRPFYRAYTQWLEGLSNRSSFDAKLGRYLPNSMAVEGHQTSGTRGDKHKGLSTYTIPVIWLSKLGGRSSKAQIRRRARSRRKRP